jgi:hypothetical protein
MQIRRADVGRCRGSASHVHGRRDGVSRCVDRATARHGVIIKESHPNMGFSGFDARLDWVGDTFDASVECHVQRGRESGSASLKGSVPASSVQDFLDVASSHHPTDGVTAARCYRTDSVTKITVTTDAEGFPILSVANCSLEWSANGIVLNPDSEEAAQPSLARHPKLNAAYRALLTASGVGQCFTNLNKSPPKPIPKPKGPQPSRYP